MRRIIELPHRVSEGTCYVNGLEDMLSWKGAHYTDDLLLCVGGMASFAYLKFKVADPPQMVYWGQNPKNLLSTLGKIVGFTQRVVEGKSFRSTFRLLREFIDSGLPVVAGALDMYYLRFYPEISGREHIPIHYLLVVGYDDDRETLYVHDCSNYGVQEISFDAFERCMDVNVPGMSKKNTIRVFELPDELPSELRVAESGFLNKAQMMLRPPVRILGIPAMRKLGEEIASWDNEASFRHLVTYATVPPVLPRTVDRSDGMRFLQSSVLRRLGESHGRGKWVKAAALFEKSGNLVKELCGYALRAEGKSCSDLIFRIAEVEEEAYTILEN